MENKQTRAELLARSTLTITLKSYLLNTSCPDFRKKNLHTMLKGKKKQGKHQKQMHKSMKEILKLSDMGFSIAMTNPL